MHTKVIHIGAGGIKDEVIEYYSAGVKQLIYIEPEPSIINKCLSTINELKKLKKIDGMEVIILPYAAWSEANQLITFYSNKYGQSSCKEPTPFTKAIAVDSNFLEIIVPTIEIKQLTQTEPYNLICIDVQGGEFEVLKTIKDGELKKLSKIVDVEIQTSHDQYIIDSSSYKNIENFFDSQGYLPLIHPSGITESYIFIECEFLGKNLKIIKQLLEESLRENNFDMPGFDHINEPFYRERFFNEKISDFNKMSSVNISCIKPFIIDSVRQPFIRKKLILKLLNNTNLLS